MSDPTRVAVILVNHKDYAGKYLPECYKSLMEQTYPKDQMTLFIADNETTEKSRALIERIVPNARLIPNTENLGWAGGNNTAIRVALAEGFDYLVMLNMDTHLDKEWLHQLIKQAEENKDLHILQSKILIYGTQRVNSLGNRIQYLGYGYCNGYGQPDTAPRRFPMDFASGAAMLIKQEVFKKIGFFHDEYFMYCEDTEFCWRARLAGFNVGLAEKSVCYHKYNFLNVMNSLYYVERNRLLTLLTLEKWGTLLLILPCLALVQAGSLVYFTWRGYGKPMGRLILYFLKPKTWKWIAAQRHRVHPLRIRKDAEIVRRFAGAVVFAEIANPFFGFFINPLLWTYWMIARMLIFW